MPAQLRLTERENQAYEAIMDKAKHVRIGGASRMRVVDPVGLFQRVVGCRDTARLLVERLVGLKVLTPVLVREVGDDAQMTYDLNDAMYLEVCSHITIVAHPLENEERFLRSEIARLTEDAEGLDRDIARLGQELEGTRRRRQGIAERITRLTGLIEEVEAVRERIQQVVMG